MSSGSIGFALFNFAAAAMLYLSIYRAQRDKRLEIMLKSGPKMEKVVIKGQGITVLTVGWVISALLFTCSGLRSVDVYAGMGEYVFMTFFSIVLAIITMLTASYISTHSEQ